MRRNMNRWSRILMTMLAMALPMIVACAASAQGNPLAPRPADRFAGTYTGDGISLTLVREGESYRGSLVFRGSEFPVRANLAESALAGTFTANGSDFNFTLRQVGSAYQLESGGAVYPLSRQAPAENTPPVTPPPAAAVAADFNLGPAQIDPNRDWTILIYLDGDNNLEPFALADLNELEAGMPERGVEIIVLIDRAEGYDESEGDWKDARIYRVTRDRDPARIASTVLSNPGELNMGDPATLASFIEAGLKTFPARRHALVMWNHGGGWSLLASDDMAPGAPGDHDGLTIVQCGQGIRDGLAAAGVEQFDLIGFDMCLMAQLETAVELMGSARVMVASQAVEPGDGWPYTPILEQFGKGTLGTTRIATEIVNAYGDFYKRRGDAFTTQSAVDLEALPDVLTALDAVLAKVEPTLDASWVAMSRSLFFAESYAAKSEIRNGIHALASIDLLDSLRRLRHHTTNFAGEQEFASLIEAMDKYVLASETSALHHRSNGVALYAPVRESLFNPAYLETRFARESRWVGLLSRLHETQKQNSAPPTIGDARLVHNDTGAVETAAPVLGGVSVRFNVEGNNILWTQALSGQYDAERKGIHVFNKWLVVDPEFYAKVLRGEKEVGSDSLLLIMPEYKDGRNELTQELQGLRYAVSNGKDASYATIDRSDISDRTHVQVPIVFEHSAVGRYGGTLYFDIRTWEVVAVVLEVQQPDGSMAYQQLREVPADAQITLLNEFIHEDGQFEYVASGTIPWNQGLSLMLGLDSPGEYYVAFTAETIAGDAATQFFSYKIDPNDELNAAVKNSGQFSAKDLVGRWEWMGTPRGQTQPQSTGLFTELRLHPENPEFLIGETTSTNDPNMRSVDLVIPDSRLMPNIRFFGLSPEGAISSYTLYSALYASQNGVTFLTLKDAETGRLMAIVKRGGDLAQNNPNNQGGANSPPQPPAQNQFAGWWVSDDGIVFGFDDRNWEMYFDDEMIDRGTYAVQADVITLQSQVSNQSVSFRFRIVGDVMTVTDQFGETSQLRRVRQQE